MNASRVTPDAVHELYRRIEQLEGDLVQRNAQREVSSQTPSSAIRTTPHAPAQGVSPQSGYSPSVTVHFFASSSIDPGRVSEFLGFHGQYLGLNWYFKGMPILSERGRKWMSSRNGQEAVLAESAPFNFQVDQHLSTTSPTELYVSRQELGELPSEHATREAIDILYNSSLRFSFPVVDRGLFYQSMTKAYGVAADTNPPR